MSLTRRTALAAGGAALATTGLATTAQAATVQVQIRAGQTKFDPQEIKIKSGDTVVWTNKGIVPHTVTCDPTKVKDAKNCELPAGATAFDSGNLAQNKPFEQRFRTKGTYRYFCKPHENMGMVGTVIVE